MNAKKFLKDWRRKMFLREWKGGFFSNWMADFLKIEQESSNYYIYIACEVLLLEEDRYMYQISDEESKCT